MSKAFGGKSCCLALPQPPIESATNSSERRRRPRANVIAIVVAHATGSCVFFGVGECFHAEMCHAIRDVTPALGVACERRCECEVCICVHNAHNGRETKATTAPRAARSRRRRLEARSVR
jgi:hypothetical protein